MDWIIEIRNVVTKYTLSVPMFNPYMLYHIVKHNLLVLDDGYKRGLMRTAESPLTAPDASK